jgi:hypothetical protein
VGGIPPEHQLPPSQPTAETGAPVAAIVTVALFAIALGAGLVFLGSRRISRGAHAG